MARFAKDNVEQVLDTFMSEVVRLAKINLGARRSVEDARGRSRSRIIDNSGALRNSLAYTLNVTPNAFSVEALMEDYGAFVDSGRDGSKKKYDKSGTLNPGAGSGSFAPSQPIQNWVRTKPIRYRNAETGTFERMTESRVKGLAYVINRKIKEWGIPPTRFFSEPFEAKFRDLPDEFVEAFALDMENFLAFAATR